MVLDLLFCKVNTSMSLFCNWNPMEFQEDISKVWGCRVCCLMFSKFVPLPLIALLQEGTVTYSRILPWRIPWSEESGGLQSIGSQRVGHNWSDLACTLIASNALPKDTSPNISKCSPLIQTFSFPSPPIKMFTFIPFL